MSVSMINLNTLLENAITLARNETLSIEEIIAKVFIDVKVCVELPTGTSSNKRTKSAAPTKEVKSRTRTAPAKLRSVPDDDVRCYARSFYEDQHLEDGRLKVMRDDSDNLYGDRCKFKKSGETDFCKHHAEKQVLGVWDNEYAGKFKTAVEKTENSTEPAPKKEPKPKVVVEKKPAATNSEDEDEGEGEEEESETELAKEKPTSKSKPTSPKIEESVTADSDAEVQDVVIDNVTYLIDTSDGTVYDYDSETEVGRYNIAGKKWIVEPKA
jgi:hypothetical protein